MADSFDDMLMGLLLSKEGGFAFSTSEDMELANRWARYSFEAGRASARRQKRAVQVKDDLNKAELPEIDPNTLEPADIFTPEELEAMVPQPAHVGGNIHDQS